MKALPCSMDFHVTPPLPPIQRAVVTISQSSPQTGSLTLLRGGI